METLGERLRKTRETRGLSRAQLSKQTSIGYSTIANIENGGMQSSTKVPTLARVLNVADEWLATGHGPRERGAALSQPPLTADELELLASYRETARSGRGVIRKQAAQVALLDPARGRRKP